MKCALRKHEVREGWLAEWSQPARLFVVLITGLAIWPMAGCGGDNPVVVDEPAEISHLDELTIANAYAVQTAVEAWSVGVTPQGYYPIDFAQANGDGNNLIQLLPGGALQENPYTNRQTVPVCRAAAYPGEVGYIANCVGWGTGYLITALGSDGELIWLSNLPRPAFYHDEFVLINCYLVQAAVEAFAAENGGGYPGDVDSANLVGKAVIDYLPGGSYLLNPYGYGQVEPSNSSNEGSTAYVARRLGGICYSYEIIGYGACSSTTIASLSPHSPEDEQVKTISYITMEAVESFAAQNGGVYPRDLNVDTTLAGDTVTDLLGQLYQNPYSGQVTEPRNAPAASSGEVGYVWQSVGASDGYIITGWGKDAEVVKIEK